jgi:hypothetical protein
VGTVEGESSTRREQEDQVATKKRKTERTKMQWWIFLDNEKTVPAFMFLGRIWPLLQQNVLKHPAKGVGRNTLGARFGG